MAKTFDLNPNLVIDELGGTSEVAKLCEIAPASVSGWREHGIPKSRLMFLRLARPKVFKRLEQNQVHLNSGSQQA